MPHQIRNVTSKLPEQMWWKSLDQKSDYVRVDVRIFAREQFVNVHILQRTPPQAYWTSYDIVIMLRANILLGTPDILYCHVLPNKHEQTASLKWIQFEKTFAIYYCWTNCPIKNELNWCIKIHSDLGDFEISVVSVQLWRGERGSKVICFKGEFES